MTDHYALAQLSDLVGRVFELEHIAARQARELEALRELVEQVDERISGVHRNALRALTDALKGSTDD